MLEKTSLDPWLLKMSDRKRVFRHAFHSACVVAVSNALGPPWMKTAPGDDSWTARFTRPIGGVNHGLELTLNQSSHFVNVSIAAWVGSVDVFPRTWWEDRRKDPKASGYKTVLWAGDVKYGWAEGSSVPRDVTSPACSEALAKDLKRLSPQAEAWFVQVGRQLLERDA